MCRFLLNALTRGGEQIKLTALQSASWSRKLDLCRCTWWSLWWREKGRTSSSTPGLKNWNNLRGRVVFPTKRRREAEKRSDNLTSDITSSVSVWRDVTWRHVTSWSWPRWVTRTFRYPENSEKVKNNNTGQRSCGALRTTMRRLDSSCGNAAGWWVKETDSVERRSGTQ